MGCITGARFNMTATVLTQGGLVPDSTSPDGTIVGHWESKQDPETGEIIRVWVMEDADPDTPEIDAKKIKCIVRGILSGGIRATGTTERYNDAILESLDYVKMQFPASVTITKRDRVTNIANKAGVIIWREEEFNNAPTVFDVLGVTPVTDPFGNLIEWSALLQRSEAQDG